MAKVAFRLSPAYQGKGLTAEALARVVVFCFEETQLQRLWSDVHIQNIASYKTLEKAGFRREGHIHEGKMVNTWCDYYLYGMTKADYVEIVDKGLSIYRNIMAQQISFRKLPWFGSSRNNINGRNVSLHRK